MDSPQTQLGESWDTDQNTAEAADDWERLTPNQLLWSLWEKYWGIDQHTDPDIAARRPVRDIQAYPTLKRRLSPLWGKNWDTVRDTVLDIVPDTETRRPARDNQAFQALKRLLLSLFGKCLVLTQTRERASQKQERSEQTQLQQTSD